MMLLIMAMLLVAYTVEAGIVMAKVNERSPGRSLFLLSVWFISYMIVMNAMWAI